MVGEEKQLNETEREANLLPLHASRVLHLHATINRIQILLHSVAGLALIYYRVSRLVLITSSSGPLVTVLAWSLISGSEFLLLFLWVLSRAYRWRPYTRTVFPERLPADDEQLPEIDVFIVTADSEKEPTMEVMNTLISTMCLDYPAAGKLSVYLSDDGGSPLTLYSCRKAYSFVGSWLPFCNKYKIQTRCPEAYFSAASASSGTSTLQAAGDHRIQEGDTLEFVEERERMEEKYMLLKECVERRRAAGSRTTTTTGSSSSHSNKGIVVEDHRHQVIEVIREEEDDALDGEHNSDQLPLLVYVAREKRKTHPHHFKAGALNVLLRVSGIISNSPYILVLDCDMYSNNPLSARQAMCFHLDPSLSPSLAFVQFPQTFHNISKNDIYCNQLENIFKVLWPGCDGLRGPILSGTGFYIKRDALYGTSPGRIFSSKKELSSSMELYQYKERFGQSNELIVSLLKKHRILAYERTASLKPLQEAQLLASCSYEKGTQWGEQIGFLYGSVVEDYFTGYQLHCRGWRSVYLYPSKPAFLGNVPINFHDTLVQTKRWSLGLLQVAFSRFCPLTYGVTKTNSLLQSMCYAWLAFQPLAALAILIYATIPQLCFFIGIPLYPQVSDRWFIAFGVTYLCSLGEHMSETFYTGGSLKMWWNEQRIGKIKSVTASLFACLDIIMKLIGASEVNFDLTNKNVEEEQTKRYENGIFDFHGSSLLILPLTTLTILNVATLIGGGIRVIKESSYDQMFGQIYISLFTFLISYRVLEAIIIRKDKGRVPTSITLLSVTMVLILLALFN